MNDKCFVDTIILVYAHDRSAGDKHHRARVLIEKLWNSGGGVLSTQVLQELCVNVRRKSSHPLSVEETRRLIQDYSSWTIVTNTAESVIEALDIESRYNISFWDALIVQGRWQFWCYSCLFRRFSTRTELWFGSSCQPAEWPFFRVDGYATSTRFSSLRSGENLLPEVYRT